MIMINFKLDEIKKLTRKIHKMEREKGKKRNQTVLTQYKNMLADLENEHIIDKIILSKEEKEMAANYYYKDMSWEMAYQYSPLYNKINPDDEKMYRKDFAKCKKRIQRAINRATDEEVENS